MDSDTLSLPEQDYQMPFNQAPGSHRGHHRRHPSLSSSSTYDPLSQEAYDVHVHTNNVPPVRGSFSQEIPMPRSQDAPGAPLERDILHHPGGHFSNPYDHEVMRPSASQYLSDPYPGGPPHPFPHDRLQRRMDFPPPPRPHPPPPRHPFWDGGYGNGPTPPGHMMGMPHRGGAHPHEMYRPGPFRTNTPDISPAPSPHPTPPTTPPPHQPMMGMQPSPLRMVPNPRPHLPNMYRGPPPLRGEFQDFHIPRGMPPPPPPMGGHMGPHHQPPPHGHIPHPPHGHLHPPRMMEWSDQPPWRH